jgi:hypothetical protein
MREPQEPPFVRGSEGQVGGELPAVGEATRAIPFPFEGFEEDRGPLLRPKRDGGDGESGDEKGGSWHLHEVDESSI